MRAILILICALLIAAPAWAGVDGANFDGEPVGPYTGGATVSPPGAAGVEVVPDDQSFAGAGNLGNGSGNMLRIDCLNNPGPIKITFTFACDIIPDNLCRVKYRYTGAAWNLGAGFVVGVDDPTLQNPDDAWEPPVAFPPTTVENGDNKENAGDCDGSVHTITFLIWPGTVVHLDDLETECLENVVPVEEHSWGTLKGMFR